MKLSIEMSLISFRWIL